MSVTSGFFNSIDHDRLYDADQMGQFFDGLIKDGVYLNYGDAFRVEAGPEDMGITVKTGRAWFMHTWTLNDTDLKFTVGDASLAYDRVDAVVIDVNKTRTVRENTIKYIAGTPNGPSRPVLIDDEDHKQYAIAYITVAKGVKKITQSAIEYVVGGEGAPFVAGFLESLNITNITNQINAEFDEWFAGIQDIMDDTTAGRLYNMINSLTDKVNINSSNIDRLIKSVFTPSEGTSLGTSLSYDQQQAIENGTFTNIYPGDYWEINGTKWYVIDYDYYMRFTPNDDTPPCTKHHVVVMPEKVFDITGKIESRIQIANKLSYEEEAPWVFGLPARGNWYNQNYGGEIVTKTYYANVSLETTTGFDWQHPMSDAVQFAKSAWGDNLVSVPDVFGNYETCYQDFTWETTEGILIPHFLDMPGPYGKNSCLNTNYSDFSSGANPLGKVLTQVDMDIHYSIAPYSLYQYGNLLPNNGLPGYFYTEANSSCRTYLTSRFLPNSGYQVTPNDLPETMKNAIYNSGKSLYLKDGMNVNNYYPVSSESSYDPSQTFQEYEDMVLVLPNFETEIIPTLNNKGCVYPNDSSGLVYGRDFCSLGDSNWDDVFTGWSKQYDSFIRYVFGRSNLHARVATPMSMTYQFGSSGRNADIHIYYGDESDAFIAPVVSDDVWNYRNDDITFWNANPYYLEIRSKDTGDSMSARQCYPIVCCVG